MCIDTYDWYNYALVDFPMFFYSYSHCYKHYWFGAATFKILTLQPIPKRTLASNKGTCFNNSLRLLHPIQPDIFFFLMGFLVKECNFQLP